MINWSPSMTAVREESIRTPLKNHSMLVSGKPVLAQENVCGRPTTTSRLDIGLSVIIVVAVCIGRISMCAFVNISIRK